MGKTSSPRLEAAGRPSEEALGGSGAAGSSEVGGSTVSQDDSRDGRRRTRKFNCRTSSIRNIRCQIIYQFNMVNGDCEQFRSNAIFFYDYDEERSCLMIVIKLIHIELFLTAQTRHMSSVSHTVNSILL